MKQLTRWSQIKLLNFFDRTSVARNFDASVFELRTGWLRMWTWGLTELSQRPTIAMDSAVVAVDYIGPRGTWISVYHFSWTLQICDPYFISYGERGKLLGTMLSIKVKLRRRFRLHLFLSAMDCVRKLRLQHIRLHRDSGSQLPTHKWLRV